MQQFVLFAFLGLATGAIYASLGVGLVISFRTAGVINFAQAAIFMMGAVQYQDIRSTGELRLPIPGLPNIPLSASDPGLWPAAAIAVVVATLLGVLAHLLVFRQLREAPPLVSVVASIGIMLTIQAAYILRYGPTIRRAPSSLPSGSVHLLGADVPKTHLWLAGIVILMTAVLTLVYSHTRFGRETSAVSEGGVVTAVLGIPRERVAAISWAIGGALAGLMGVLFASISGVDVATYPLMIVPALGAALIGRFRSFGWTAFGGFVIAIGQSWVTYFQSQSWVPSWSQSGLQDGLPFLVIIFLLWQLGRPVAQRGEVIVSRLPRVPEMSTLWGGAPVLLVLGVPAILLSGSVVRLSLVQGMITAVLALSIVLLTGFVGQVSLAQAAFAGMGGFTFAILATRADVPLPLAQICAVLAAAALGAIVALPALRIRGLQLAIVTLAAGVAIENFVFKNTAFTGGQEGIEVPSLTYGPLDLSPGTGRDFPNLGFTLFILGNLIVAYLLVRGLRRSTLGKRFLSIRANERGASAVGLDPRRLKLLAFCLSAAIAGWSGVLTANLRENLSFTSFGTFVSISVLALAYLGGISRPSGAIIAGFISAAGPLYYFLDSSIGFGKYMDLVSGLGLIVTAVQQPEGIAAAFADLGTKLDPRRRRRRPEPPEPTPLQVAPADVATTVGQAR